MHNDHIRHRQFVPVRHISWVLFFFHSPLLPSTPFPPYIQSPISIFSLSSHFFSFSFSFPPPLSLVRLSFWTFFSCLVLVYILLPIYIFSYSFTWTLLTDGPCVLYSLCFSAVLYQHNFTSSPQTQQLYWAATRSLVMPFWWSLQHSKDKIHRGKAELEKLRPTAASCSCFQPFWTLFLYIRDFHIMRSPFPRPMPGNSLNHPLLKWETDIRAKLHWPNTK